MYMYHAAACTLERKANLRGMILYIHAEDTLSTTYPTLGASLIQLQYFCGVKIVERDILKSGEGGRGQGKEATSNEVGGSKRRHLF